MLRPLGVQDGAVCAGAACALSFDAHACPDPGTAIDHPCSPGTDAVRSGASAVLVGPEAVRPGTDAVR
eukprot:3941812-Rhodomonas_salina.13